MTLPSLSGLMVRERGGEDIVAWRGKQPMKFGRFLTDAVSVANTYSACSAAALICQDSYNFATGFFGLLHAGARLVLPPAGQKAVLESLQDRFETVVDDAAVEAARGASDRRPLMPLDPSLPAIDFYTSGSTGTPKRIAKSLAMFDREVAAFEQAFGTGLGDAKVFATVPHQHMYGLPFKLLWSLAAGRAFTAETYALWETLLADLTPNAIVVSSPAHLSRLSGLEPLAAHNRPKLILSAGAPLPLTASDDAASILGCRPLEIFGSTETGAMARRIQRTGNDPWQLLPGIAIRCDDEGRMSVCTPIVGPEWIEMSDLVEMVDGGFIHRGRADRIVKIEGKRICLINVEEALQNHPYVKSVAVIALKDPLRLAAAVVPNEEGKKVLAEQGAFRFGRLLRKSLLATLDPEGVPRYWRFIDAMPSHVMGKRRDGDIAVLFGTDT